MHRITSLLAAVLVLWAGSLKSAELWMFEEAGCYYCMQWHAEIGDIYPKTQEGRIAPLRQLDLHGLYPADVELAMRPQYSPTFVLVDNGREIGRIEGYPGEDWFWALIGQLIDKLPPPNDTKS